MEILKRIERAGRRLGVRAVVALLGNRRAPEPLDVARGTRASRILFLRYDRIGDMVLSTGIIRALATAHRNLRIDVLASPTNASVLKHDPHVTNVIALDRWKPWTYPAVFRRLRAAQYDAVLDSTPTTPSFTSLLLLWASGARHRIGIAGRGTDDALTIAVPPRANALHVVEHYSALLAAFGVAPETADVHPKLHLTTAELAAAESIWQAHTATPGARRVLVNVSVGRDFREWPDQNFVEVLEHLRQREPDSTRLVIGSPVESARVTAIAARSGAAYTPAPSIREAFSLVATADVVCTPDTSIAHAASACLTPAVVFYSSGHGDRWGLYNSPGRILVSPDRLMSALPATSVIAELDALLDGLSEQPKAEPQQDAEIASEPRARA